MPKTYIPVPSEDSYGRRLTKKILVWVPASLVAYDVTAYCVWGNDSTLSKVILDTSTSLCLVGTILLLSVGTLMGHFLVPQHVYVISLDEKDDIVVKIPKQIDVKYAISKELERLGGKIVENTPERPSALFRTDLFKRV